MCIINFKCKSYFNTYFANNICVLLCKCKSNLTPISQTNLFIWYEIISATSSFVNLGQDAQNDDETELDSEAEESQENDDAQDFPEGLNQQPNVTEKTESTSGK